MTQEDAPNHCLHQLMLKELEQKTSFQDCLEVAALYESFGVEVTSAIEKGRVLFLAGMKRGQSTHLSNQYLILSKPWAESLKESREQAAVTVLKRYAEHHLEWHGCFELLDAVSDEDGAFAELRTGAIEHLINRAHKPRDLLELASKTKDCEAKTVFLLALSEHAATSHEDCIAGIKTTTSTHVANILAERALSLHEEQ